MPSWKPMIAVAMTPSRRLSFSSASSRNIVSAWSAAKRQTARMSIERAAAHSSSLSPPGSDSGLG
jgi:hypothetical protein